MDLVDSALLDDMLFQWQETPFCTLTDIDKQLLENHSIDGMLVDIDLPEITIPEPSSHPTATPAKPVSSPLWPCDSTSTPNSNILQAASVSGRNINKFPLVVLQKGASFDSLAASPTSPQSASAPFTPPAVKPKRSQARKGGSKSKTTVPKANKPTVAVLEAQAEQAKENRVPTQVEHIIRERQRRDDMAAKYLILESLLPPASKRERAVVVEDATLLVKTLQQKKAELLKRRAHLKLEAPNPNSPRSIQNIRLAPLHDFSGTVVTASGCMMQQSAVMENNCKSDNSPSSSDGRQGQENNLINTSSRVVLSSTVIAMNVHIGEEEIVMEMVWSQPRPNFQSVLLQAVESLGLEVIRCSILRLASGFIQCIITCTKSKVPSQLTAEIQSASAFATLIMAALRTMLTQSS